jgi:hypothetical protein
MSIRTLSKNTISLSRNLGYDKVGKYLTKRRSIFGAAQGESKGRFFIEYLIVGGGGSGGSGGGGGGGGGGVIIGVVDAAPSGNLSVGQSGDTFGIAIGAVTGYVEDARGYDGNATNFGSFQAYGGGGGGFANPGPNDSANRARDTVGGGGGMGKSVPSGRSRSNMGGRGGVAAPSGKLGPGQSYDNAKNGRGGNDTGDEIYWSQCYSVGERLYIGGSQVGGEELITDGMYVFVDDPNTGGKPGDVPITQFPPGTAILGCYVDNGFGESSAPNLVKNGGGRNGEYRIGRSQLTLGSPGTALGAGVGQTFGYFDQGNGPTSWNNDPNKGSPSVKWQLKLLGSSSVLRIGGGGGGGAGFGTKGGTGGSGYGSSISGYSRTYAAGGGGSHNVPNDSMTVSPSMGENGRGSVNQGGDDLFAGGTSPGNSSTTDGNGNPSTPSQTGWPLPPFGNKSGFGGTDGTSSPAKNALNNRGGGGGGSWNGSNSYETWPYNPSSLWDSDSRPPPNASAPLWPTSTGTRNWPGRAGARAGGRGGSGIVIIKYPIVFGNVTTTGTPITTVTDNGFLVYEFVDSGSIKFDYTP